MGKGLDMGGSYQSSTGKFSGTTTSDRTYNDPRAQTGLNFLQSFAGGSGQDQSSPLASYYQNLIKTGGGNPNLENLLATTRTNAQQGLNNNLAKVRSAGFRGGAARDVMNQAGTVSDFENQLAQQEAGLRYNDFAQGQQAQLAGASGWQNLLQGNSAQQAAAATALLQALQGSTTSQKGRQKESGFGLESAFNLF
jgi:hypothetical protein